MSVNFCSKKLLTPLQNDHLYRVCRSGTTFALRVTFAEQNLFTNLHNSIFICSAQVSGNRVKITFITLNLLITNLRSQNWYGGAGTGIFHDFEARHYNFRPI